MKGFPYISKNIDNEFLFITLFVNICLTPIWFPRYLDVFPACSKAAFGWKKTDALVSRHVPRQAIQDVRHWRVIGESSLITHACLSHITVGSDVKHLGGGEVLSGSAGEEMVCEAQMTPQGNRKEVQKKRGESLRESFRTRPGSQGQGCWRLIPSGGRIKKPP